MKNLLKIRNYLVLLALTIFLFGGCKKESFVANETLEDEISLEDITACLDTEFSMLNGTGSLKSSGYTGTAVFYPPVRVDASFTNAFSHVFQLSEKKHDYTYYVLLVNKSEARRTVTITETIGGATNTRNIVLEPMGNDYSSSVYGVYYCQKPSTFFSINIQSSGAGNMFVRLAGVPAGNIYVGDYEMTSVRCHANPYIFPSLYTRANSVYRVYSWTTLGELDNQLSTDMYNLEYFDVNYSTNGGKFAIAHSLESTDNPATSPSGKVVVFYNGGVQVGVYHLVDPKPEVKNQAPNFLNYRNVLFGGLVEFEGASDVTESGLCWSTSPSPTLNDNKKVASSTVGLRFLTNLPLNLYTVYYVRSYAINSQGVSYGADPVGIVIRKDGIYVAGPAL